MLAGTEQELNTDRSESLRSWLFICFIVTDVCPIQGEEINFTFNIIRFAIY
jgi:hypothetical protein